MFENLRQLFQELRRRRVFRVAAVYAVVAWVLIQVAETVFPVLEMPAWTLKLVVLLALFGFPVAVVLAWAFDVTPEGLQRTAGRVPAVAPVPVQPGRVLARRGMWFVIGFLVAGSGAWVAIQQRGGRATLDSNMVAVLPFRFSGDPSYGYLREGMLDLLAATLTGEGGPRSSDPRSLLAAWKRAVQSPADDLPEDAALQFARDLGAGQVLLGGAVATRNDLTLTAKVLAVPGGRVRAEASEQGPPDSLTVLVERLSVKLLTQLAGEQDVGRSKSLAGASLPLLRTYLAGLAAYRTGHYRQAAQHFEEALRMDSTFALAAMGLGEAVGWNAENVDARWEADRRAWEARERLSERDRKLLMARLGPNYPKRSTIAETVRAAEEAVAVAPDRPEAWYRLGDLLFHNGYHLDAQYLERSARALDRAVSLDSSFVGPMLHLVEIASNRLDRDAVRTYAELTLGSDSTGEAAEYMRWHLARATGDTKMRAELRTRFARSSVASLRWITNHGHWAPWDTLDVNDAVLTASALAASATSEQERSARAGAQATVAFNRGRYQEARQYEPAPNDTSVFRHIRPLHIALLWGTDLPAGERAAQQLAKEALAPLPADTGAPRWQWHWLAINYEWWELSNGRTQTVDATLAKIRRMHAEIPADRDTWLPASIALLEAMRAQALGSPDALELARRFHQRAGEMALGTMYGFFAARLFESAGDLEAALRAVPTQNSWLRAAALREEGRLAAQLGQKDRAIRAYQRYLLLRHDPEPAVKPEVDQVRAELAKLVGEQRTAGR